MSLKQPKYTMSLMDSFNRAFNDSKAKKREKKHIESDSDSAKEEENKIILKRQKKKRRLKNKKGIKTPSSFSVRHVVKKESVTPEDLPEVLSVESQFKTDKNIEYIEAEENFFSTRNQDSSNKDFSHVRPYDYPFLRYMIQQKPQESFDIWRLKDRAAMRSKIEAVSRSYEEEMLREPKGCERQCLMGNKCEGLNISQAKDRVFILREFLLPSEQAEYEKTGKYPNEVRLCVMCKRVEILRAFINIKADTMGIKHDSILQDYRNLVNMKGEYRLQDCILSSRHVFEGIIDPVVLHIRSAYRLVEKNGLRYYEQWRMAYPTQNQHFLVEAPSH